MSSTPYTEFLPVRIKLPSISDKFEEVTIQENTDLYKKQNFPTPGVIEFNPQHP